MEEQKASSDSLCKFSMIISTISIIATVIINLQIAKEYSRVGRKTQVWFGITEALQFGYQYYIVVIGIVALLFSIISIKKKKEGPCPIIAVVISLLAIIVVFLKIWRLFV